MGLTAGGRMRQEIYADPHGVDAWDQTHRSRCFVTILNARVWKWLTGADPHNLPPAIADYEEHRIPWFDFYAADQETLEGSSVLAKVKSVLGQLTNAAKATPSSNIKSLGPDQRPVREAGSLSGQGGIDSINHE